MAGDREADALTEGRFRIGDRVGLQFRVKAYRPKPSDPRARPLHVYALDPAYESSAGATTTVDVPFEPMRESGSPHRFAGAVVEVDCRDEDGTAYPLLDLDHRDVLLSSGVRPTTSDPRFHQHMVYAVTMSPRWKKSGGLLV